MNLFELRGNLPVRTKLILEIIGICMLLLLWYIITAGSEPIVPSGILPSPGRVIQAMVAVFYEKYLTSLFSWPINLALSKNSTKE